MNEKPLTPWVISMEDGKILAAHCDCMAGLGESCTHVASLLWVVAVGVERRESLTVTQKSAYWVMPPAVRSVAYAPIKEIEFIGKKRKAVRGQSVADEESTGTSSTTRQKKLTIPSEEEQKQFF